MLPLVVDLDGQRVLVIGAGAVGAHKARQLIAAGASVKVIAREVAEGLPAEVASVEVRNYQFGDLDGAFLVVSATGDAAANDQIIAEASERHLWVNVVDDPSRSNFFFTATHRDGDVIVSVSTSGASPALAQWLRDRLAYALPVGIGRIAEALRTERRALRSNGHSTEHQPWRDRIEQLVTELNDGATLPTAQSQVSPIDERHDG